MRALTIDAHGGLEQVRLRDDIPVPEIDNSRHVRVQLHAAALNHLDVWTLHGIPGSRIHPGWILGADGAGVIEETGSGVTQVHRGDSVIINPGISCGRCEYCVSGEEPLCLKFRLLGEHLPGTLAEFVVVPEGNVRVIPESFHKDMAAAYPLVTLTAWRMCVSRARVRPNDTVLVWGIGGGVALATLQICKMIGAEVWVTSHSEEKLARARALGADETIRHGAGIDIGQEVRARTGKRGVDVIIDSVGSASWAQSLGALGRRGRLVTCGGTSGAIVETDIRRLFWNQWTIMGSTMGSSAEFDAITQAFVDHRLTPVVDSIFPLADGRDALVRMESPDRFGKVVVRIL